MKKYFKPKSITWWTGFVALASGTTIAVGGEVDTVRPAANILSTMSQVPPAVMISFGLGLIGLRGKDG